MELTAPQLSAMYKALIRLGDMQLPFGLEIALAKKKIKAVLTPLEEVYNEEAQKWMVKDDAGQPKLFWVHPENLADPVPMEEPKPQGFVQGNILVDEAGADGSEWKQFVDKFNAKLHEVDIEQIERSALKGAPIPGNLLEPLLDTFIS